jgi:hypothetical protein
MLQPLLFQFKKAALEVRVISATRHLGTVTCALPIKFGTRVHLEAPNRNRAGW